MIIADVIPRLFKEYIEMGYTALEVYQSIEFEAKQSLLQHNKKDKKCIVKN